ncbi:MAG: MerR family transcriptional regulator, partial [Ruthenibacterium sp.]
TKQSIENPEDFISNNKEILAEYFAYKQSAEYKNSPVFQIQSLLKEFNSTSGYDTVFIPMIKQLSPAYAKYYSQMEIANDKLLAQYPVIANLGG